MRRAYLSLGSNVGDRAQHLERALAIVVAEDSYRVSSVFQTEPVGGVEQDDFWNLVVEVTTNASPRELLERCQRAETSEGRTRELRWGPRTLDADVLLVGNESSDDPDIIVPHPRMFERAFVLVPLAQLAPELFSEEVLAAGVGGVVELGTLSSLR